MNIHSLLYEPFDSNDENNKFNQMIKEINENYHQTKTSVQKYAEIKNIQQKEYEIPSHSKSSILEVMKKDNEELIMRQKLMLAGGTIVIFGLLVTSFMMNR